MPEAEDEPAPIEDAIAETLEAGLDDQPDPEPEPVAEPAPAPQLVATRMAGRANRPSGPLMGWMALASAIVAVVAGTVLLSEYVVELWPPAKRLYAMVNLPISSPAEGLEVRNIQVRYEESDDGPRLIIEGDIVNVSNEIKVVPPMRVALRGADQEILTDWAFVATDINMMPNEIVTFRTNREAPPENAIGAALGFSSEPPPGNGVTLERSAARD